MMITTNCYNILPLYPMIHIYPVLLHSFLMLNIKKDSWS